MRALLIAIAMSVLAQAPSRAAVPAPVVVKEFPPTSISPLPWPRSLTAADDKLYFVVEEDTNHPWAGYAVWVTDGTDAGTVRVLGERFLGILASAGGGLFFTSDEGLWRTDGTTAGTVLVDPSYVGVETIVGTSEGFFFSTSPYPPLDRHHFVDFWAALGAPVDVRLLGQLGEVGAPQVATLGTTLVLLTQDFTTKMMSLWVSNGTPSGTLRVNDAFGEDLPQTFPSSIVGVPGGVYFSRCSDSGVCSMWWSDLTPEGTVELTRFRSYIRAEDESWDDPALMVAGRRLFFTALDDANVRELWTSDGTPSGTVKLTGPTGPYVFRSHGLVDYAAIDGVLFFSATDHVDGSRMLWRTDGTRAGTAVVSRVEAGNGSMRAIGKQLFFPASSAEAGYELWTSDGTEAGTALVADLNPGPGGSDPSELTEAAGNLFFTAARSQYDRQLYTIDLPPSVTTTTIPACYAAACAAESRCILPACTDTRCVSPALAVARRFACACEHAAATCANYASSGLPSQLRLTCALADTAVGAARPRRMRASGRKAARRMKRAARLAAERGLPAECRAALDDAVQSSQLVE